MICYQNPIGFDSSGFRGISVLWNEAPLSYKVILQPKQGGSFSFLPWTEADKFAALSGGVDATTIDGGADNDTLYGGKGNDTYQLRNGSGSDRINENDATEGNTDVLAFGPGWLQASSWPGRPGWSSASLVLASPG